MLHQHATGGTGSDAGTAVDPLHVLEDDVRTVFQCLQRIWAAVIVTAVWARSPTFPFPQTLPAEPVSPSLAGCAHWALYIQIGEVISHHTRLATRTLWRQWRMRWFLFLFTAVVAWTWSDCWRASRSRAHLLVWCPRNSWQRCGIFSLRILPPHQESGEPS